MEPVPVGGGPFYKEPSLVIGALITLLMGIKALVDGGGLSDGLSLNEVLTIVLPVLTGLGIRFKVFSQQTVDLIAPREKQARAVAAKKRLD